MSARVDIVSFHVGQEQFSHSGLFTSSKTYIFEFTVLKFLRNIKKLLVTINCWNPEKIRALSPMGNPETTGAERTLRLSFSGVVGYCPSSLSNWMNDVMIFR